MDPCSALGLAASILQIINTTAQTIQYLKDVRDAPEDRAQILGETASLLGLLKDLRARVEHANQTDPWYVRIRLLEGQGGPLDQYQSAMIVLAKKLKPESGLKKLEKRLLWTFDRKQIKATLDLIERLKSLISLALQGDHFELSRAVKMETHEVRDYISIMSKNLENVVESVAELKLGQEKAAKQYLDEEQQKVLEWLSPLNFASKQVDTFARHQPGTGKWLFEEEVFKAWLAGDNNALWCSGIPGAGKTILTSIVVNHLECSHPFKDNAVAVLYLSYRDQEEQLAKNLIGSLVRQVAHSKRTLSDNIIGLYNNHTLKRSRPTINELSNLLRSEITHLSEVFVLVDAMDECSVNNDTREELLTTLQSLLEMPNVRMMVTSRPVASIEAHLQGMAYLEIRAADEDVRKYVENRIPKKRRLIPFVHGDDAFRASIIDTIIAKAQGMFLMAQLHLESLANENNKQDVRLALQSLPEKLDDTYDEAIKRIFRQGKKDVQLAKRTLMWISCAKRSLSIIELQRALATKLEAKELDPESLPHKDVIVDVCSGLVAVDRESETIRLVHYTTQDYLVRVRAELFATAEIDMTFCCLTYLLFSKSAEISEFEEPVSFHQIRDNVDGLKAAYPFWSYAARFWGLHAHEKAQYDARIQKLVFQLLEPNNKALALARSEPLRNHRSSLPVPPDVPGLHTAAYFDLTGLVDAMLDQGTLVDAKTNEYSLTALHCAAIGGHVATLTLLLDRGAFIDMPYEERDTALIIAAHQGHRDSVQFLLERGADIERQGFYGRTVLFVAASSGHKSIVELLLEKGADVDGQNHDEMTPLYIAAEEGHQSVVELLLEKGADVDKQDHGGRTPLYLAASKGHHSVVELLLENGADINRQDRQGRTALWLPVKRGLRTHGSVVKLLLENGADVNIRDSAGLSVLHDIVMFGKDSIFEILLRSGANLEGRTPERDGATPLIRAARFGKKHIVQFLIDAGADLEAEMSYKGLKSTASDIAKKYGHMAVFELLQEAIEQRKTLPTRNLTQSQNPVDKSNSPTS